MTHKQGHYEIRPHQTPGLVTIMWCEPGQPPQPMTTIGEQRVAPLADATAAWARKNPRPADVNGEKALPTRVRTGGPRGGALSVANDDPEGGK